MCCVGWTEQSGGTDAGRQLLMLGSSGGESRGPTGASGDLHSDSALIQKLSAVGGELRVNF